MAIQMVTHINNQQENLSSQNNSANNVLFEVSEQGVASVTLNCPEKHNAFDDNVIATLTAIFSEISQRQDIRVVILQANGKSFSAGADLAWMKRMASYSFEDNLADANKLAEMLSVLNFLPQPTLGKIQGAAFGGAVGLASCCDIVLASDKASFCLSEVKLGLIPATISPHVINAIGVKASRRYFQTAERFSADKARQLGLVDEVIEHNNLNDSVDAMIKTILSNGPKAMRQAKALIFDVAYQTIDSNLLTETSKRIANIRISDEGQEGLNSFFEKRPPQWTLNKDSAFTTSKNNKG